VKNVGDKAGEEVAQVYFHDCEASVSRPVKELVGFQRIHLDKGESYRITVTVEMEMLAFYDEDMNFIVEPGNMEVFVGSSSEDIRLRDRFEITGNTVKFNERKVFSSKVTVEKL